MESPTKTATKSPATESPESKLLVTKPTPEIQNGHANGHVVKDAEHKDETMLSFASIKIDDADLGKKTSSPVKLEPAKSSAPVATPPSTV